jgi:hypothetical protein
MDILIWASYRHTSRSALLHYFPFNFQSISSIGFFWFFDPWSLVRSFVADFFRQVHARCVPSKHSESVVSVRFREGNFKVSVVLAEDLNCGNFVKDWASSLSCLVKSVEGIRNIEIFRKIRVEERKSVEGFEFEIWNEFFSFQGKEPLLIKFFVVLETGKSQELSVLFVRPLHFRPEFLNSEKRSGQFFGAKCAV